MRAPGTGDQRHEPSALLTVYNVLGTGAQIKTVAVTAHVARIRRFNKVALADPETTGTPEKYDCTVCGAIPSAPCRDIDKHIGQIMVPRWDGDAECLACGNCGYCLGSEDARRDPTPYTCPGCGAMSEGDL